MSWWNAKYKNNFGEYEITFGSKDYEKVKAVERLCQAIIDKKVKSPEDLLPVLRGWISVEDALPKSIINKVLVCCKNGYIGFGHYEEFQGVKDWYNLESGKPFTEWDLEDCESYAVTHWMPLPEAPKEEV